MHTPLNTFKTAMQNGPAQIGLWVGLADGYAAEILAGVGYDWLLIDGEHAPNDVRSVLAQLQAISSAWAALPHRTQPVVRLPVGETALIKQYLDIGAQTLLIPMVDTAEQAAQLAQAMRYPPEGIRGMGSALARASRWQAHPNYIHEANAQACLLVQAETVEAMKNLDAIAATPGVDGVFIGPADLSASLGHVGDPNHPEVQAAIEDAIARILKAGKAPGILTSDEAQARHYLALGAVFVAVGLDTGILVRQTSALAAKFKSGATAALASKGSVY